MERYRQSTSLCLLLALLFLAPMALTAELPSPLTLEEALNRVNRESPILAGFGWELRAADARVVQAGLRPNPELSLEVEEIPLGSRSGSTGRKQAIHGSLAGGTPSLSLEHEREDGGASLDDVKISVVLAQAIELGRKRARRVALAEEQRALRRWDYETARADVLAQTAHAFVEALAAQDRQALQRELLELATEVERTIALRVEAGKVSPLERNRAEVARSTAAIAMGLAERAERSARAALASYWGGQPDDFGRLAGRLGDTGSVPELEELREAIQDNPDVARWAAEMSERLASLNLERARRVPDMTIALGVESAAIEAGGARGFEMDSGGGLTAFRSSRDADDREYSLKFEVSVPLPLFNRNQGNIGAAGHLATKVSEERRAAVAQAWRRASMAREEAAGALDEYSAIQAEVLPTAGETFRKTQIGYREGKFGYLDVLDTQRTLFSVRSAQLEALARHHHAMIDLERITGAVLTATKEDIHYDDE